MLQVATQKNKVFLIKDFFSQCDQMRSFLRIWWHLLKKKKSLMENLCAHLCKFNPFCTNVSNYFIKALQQFARNTKKRWNKLEYWPEIG